jgi:hypothetical protein
VDPYSADALIRSLRGRLALSGAVALVTASCGWVWGPLELPWSPTVRGAGLCVPDRIHDPVVGRLVGDPGDPRLLWLVDDQRQRLEIVWPAGYTVDFRASAVLNESGRRVIAVGERLVIEHVRRNDYDGTADDPYPVGGIVDERCLR